MPAKSVPLSPDLVDTLKKDRFIRKLNRRAKKVKIHYKHIKKEIRSFTVGAVQYRIGKNYDFEKAIFLMEKAQSQLDRLMTIGSDLGEIDLHLSGLEEEGTSYLNGFDSVTRLRTAEIRKSVIEGVLRRIVSRRSEVADLKYDVEQFSWNLKHAFSVMKEQADLGKQVWFMRNPGDKIHRDKR